MYLTRRRPNVDPVPGACALQARHGAGVRDPYRVDVLSRPQGQDRDQIRIETCPQVDGALAVATTPCHARGPGAWAGGVAPRTRHDPCGAWTAGARSRTGRRPRPARAMRPRPGRASGPRGASPPQKLHSEIQIALTAIGAVVPHIARRSARPLLCATWRAMTQLPKKELPPPDCKVLVRGRPPLYRDLTRSSLSWTHHRKSPLLGAFHSADNGSVSLA